MAGADRRLRHPCRQRRLRAGPEPDVRGVRASSRASARAPTSCARRCTTSSTRATATWRCAPRARRRWCGPSSSTGRPMPWKVWYAAPSFRYERPQAGRYRQHHQLGVEVLGTRRPRSRRRGHRAARRLLPRPRAAARSSCVLNSMGTADDRAPLRRRRPQLPRGHHRRPRPDRRREGRGPPAAGARLQAADDHRRHRRRPPDHRPPRATTPSPTSSGCRPGSTAVDVAVPHRTAARARPRLLHPHHLRVRQQRPRQRRSRPSAAAVATTGWSSPSAGRRPRASASAAASSGSCSPATPRACFGALRADRRRLRGRHHRRRGRP